MTFARISALVLMLASGFAHPESPASSPASPSWQAAGGEMTLELRGDYLPDFGIDIQSEGRPLTGRESLGFSLAAIEPLELNVRWGNVESFQTERGLLIAGADLAFRRNGGTVRVDGLKLQPSSRGGYPVITVLDMGDHPLFTLSHMHLSLRPDSAILSATNAEVEASADLARRLDFKELAGMPIGRASLTLRLSGSRGSEPAGLPPGCDDRPRWPQENQGADIELIGMDNVAYQGTHADGRIKIAPSATLKNISNVDVPWIRQFESLGSYPYEPRDQHAYLVWNLYRIAAGRIDMLAASGAKHAFYTVNQNCDFACGSNNVVWPGCEDLYAADSNDLSTHQGARDEILASTGTWDSCGSFFDPDCEGTQEGYAGNWQHRLLVDPAELQRPDAEYFVDAWYVVQYDIDIWNTMGYVSIDPQMLENGWLMNEGEYQGGPVLSRWVAENDSDPDTDHDVITIPSETPDAPYPANMPQGHLRLAVRVTETAPGRYRYRYALQNYDFERALEGFRLDLPDGANVFETAFNDIDSDAGNDWRAKVTAGGVRFQAPPDNTLKWFTLFNFEIETDAAPVESQVQLGLCPGTPSELSITTLAPASGTDLIFANAFLGSSC